jgi:hypothetical protein
VFEGLTVTGILGLFVVVALVLYRSQRNENAASEARQSQLDSMRQAGIDVPREIYDDYSDSAPTQ